MKEEIETTHFEHIFAVLETNRAAEATPHPNRSRCCAFHHNLFSHGFYRVMSVKFLFSHRQRKQDDVGDYAVV